MTLGRTSTGAIKIKTDTEGGGLRAVECGCCGCDFTIEAAKTTTIASAYNFDISTPSWSGQFTVPIEETGYPLLNYKKICGSDTPQDFLGPCSEDADYIYYYVSITKFLTPAQKIPCLICDDPSNPTPETCCCGPDNIYIPPEDYTYSWGGTWINFQCDYELQIAKDQNKQSFFYLYTAWLYDVTEIPLPNNCMEFSVQVNWGYELRPCSRLNPSAGGLTAKQAYQGLFEGGDLWTPWTLQSNY
jgi:hypothetical protein